jgi:hypothetical protein
MLKKKLILLVFLFAPGLAFAAPGACPSGANYLQASANSLVTLSTLGVTGCYYVAANGSDSNAGTSEVSPWLHAPGMSACSSNCSSAHLAAGAGLIFRGGDTWHLGNSGSSPYIGSAVWNQSASGTSSNPIYVGVDPGWFSGGSWSRPIFSGDNGLWDGASGLPSSCPVHDFGVASMINLGNFNIFDNIDMQQWCSSYSGRAANPNALSAGNNDIVQNFYCHGWTITSGSNNLYNCASGGSGVLFTHDVFDGSDSPHYAAGSSNCKYEPSWPCATGQGIYDRAYVIEFSVFRYMANEAVTVDTVSAHDNVFEYLEWPPTGAMVNAQHPDSLMVYSGALNSFYNNVIRHNYVTQLLYANVNSGATLYFFNNVFYDNLRYDNSGDTAPTNCVNLAAQTSGGNETLQVYNNTFDNDTDDSKGGGCRISIYGTSNGNSMGYTWSGNIYSANNHLIGYSNLASLFNVRSSGASYTVVDNGGNAVQSTGNARSQGYVQSTAPVGDAPASAGVATIGAGVDESSTCSVFSSNSALCYGTTGGPLSSSGSLISPALPNNARGTAWNSGAFQFVAPFGNIDSAIDTATGTTRVGQSDNLKVSGWAADGQQRAPVSTVSVLIDGSAVGNAALGYPRPDVAAVYNNPAYLDSGWSFTYSAAGLSIGTHAVTSVVYDTFGNSKQLPGTRTITVSAGGPPFGWVDSAIDTATGTTNVGQSDSLKVSGWAADVVQGAPVSTVTVQIDGTAVGNATLGYPRSDVATAYNNPAYLHSGWSFTYSAASLSIGTHTVTAVAYDSLGYSKQFSAIKTITVSAGGPPFGWIDSAIDATTGTTTVSQADNLNVSGWAADVVQGAPVSTVTVQIDGTAVGNATLGYARPDVAAAYNKPAYLDSGWSFTYSAAGLSIGTHTVTAVAYDSLGYSKQFSITKTITVSP